MPLWIVHFSKETGWIVGEETYVLHSSRGEKRQGIPGEEKLLKSSARLPSESSCLRDSLVSCQMLCTMWSARILLVLFIVTCRAMPPSTLYEGDQCVLGDTEISGVCRVLQDCPEAVQNLNQGYKPQRCGFKGSMEVVCCAKIESLVKPTLTPSIPVNVSTSSRQRITSSQQEGDQCVLGDTEVSGVCRLLKDCPEAVKYLNQGYKSQRCGFSGTMEVVCCAKITGLVKPTPTPSIPVNVTQRMTPSQQACSEYNETIPLRLNPFIYGGTVAVENEFPHMAALGYRTNGQDLTWGCGGSLISENFILTAAHCTLTRIGDPVVVRLGQLDLTTAANEVFSEVEVTQVIRHPRYRRSSAYWDIALLELVQPVTFSKAVHPACLHDGPDPQLDEELIVAGWGAINRRNTERSNILMRANLRQVPLQECNKTYGQSVRQTAQGLNNDMICAADPNGNQDTCEGDSGGALQIILDKDRDLYSLIGVTSMGPSLCGNREPTIYTRVASYINWIESHVWPTQSPSRGTRTAPESKQINKVPEDSPKNM